MTGQSSTTPPDPMGARAEAFLDEVLVVPADECECGDPYCLFATPVPPKTKEAP
jgi:hypothetical protein